VSDVAEYHAAPDIDVFDMTQLTVRQAFDQAQQHHKAGRLQEADQLYRLILAQQPSHAGAMHYLGVIAHQEGRKETAVQLIRQALTLIPNDASAHSNLGNSLKDLGRLDEAIAEFRKAVSLDPKLAEPHSNLGNALRDKDELDEAIVEYRRALAIQSNYAEAHYYLASALTAVGQLNEAIIEYRRAIAMRPNDAEAHMHLAMTLLLRCEFELGWAEYEWRWKLEGFQSLNREFARPPWTGGELGGRTILIHAEQGFGDAIQFIRYLPLVAQRGGKVIARIPKDLIRLLGNLPGPEKWITPDDPLPEFDLHCSLLSLPHIFGTNLRSIPAQKDPLEADEALVNAWERRFRKEPAGIKVGLAWAGSRAHSADRYRSIPFSKFAPLATDAGVVFYSLQKGDAAREAAAPPAKLRITDWTEELKDFADTAALIANLDLVISVDTSVAHLAAAMGKPVWLLLPFIPDWRWLLDRQDSPWYPTMRLFRQHTRGDWNGVIAKVAEELVARKTNGQ
jgi:Flp pilus assembly protein TadD